MNTDPRPLPSQDYLKECFDYDPRSGVLTRKARPLHHFRNERVMNATNGQFAGRCCDSVASNGYVEVRFDGCLRLAHRVIWKIVTGADPVSGLDHIDGGKANNAWVNLREATRAENSFNTGPRKSNQSGLKGVCWDGTKKKFIACIRVNGRTKHIGNFATAEQAATAYRATAETIHGEFLHHSLRGQ